jgi:hypothetical protein
MCVIVFSFSSENRDTAEIDIMDGGGEMEGKK